MRAVSGFRELFQLGLKRLGREVDHSSPSSAEVKKKCNYVSAPHVGLYGVCTDNNTLYHLRMLIISPSVFTNCPLNLSNFPEWPDQNINLTFWRRIFFQILAHLYLKCE
jgi:hypothetical protein